MTRPLGCILGIHAKVWSGTGMMGDGHRCVVCGHDTYGFIGIALRTKKLDNLTPKNEGLTDAQRWEQAK